MNQTFVRRAGMALGIWNLWRYQWQPCRWLPLTIAPGHEHTSGNEREAARWLGTIRIGGSARHALFVPPGCHAAYRLVAPPHSRVVAWCGVGSDGLPDANGIEFVATVRREQAPRDLTARLRVPAGRTGDRRWRKLVIELRNREVQHIELTLAIRMESTSNAATPTAYWGEPRLEWRRPRKERRAVLRAASRLVRRGRLMAAARTLHGTLAEGARNSRYQIWLRERALSPAMIEEMRRRSASLPYRPLVSVVTPVYNTDARWLRACIESVRSQAYPNWELCLADDGSTRAETRAVVREYEGDPRIKIKRLAANAGIAAASNEALTLAEGEFVAFLDHDDELTPDALYEMVVHLNQHQDADFVYSDEDKLELDGTRSNVYFKPDWSPEHFLTNMYTCHLMVVRRSLLERIGGFRPGYEGAQDYDLVLRLIDHAPQIHHVPKVLYQWRRIPESTAGHEGAKPWAHDAGKLALEDYVRRNKINAEVLPGAVPYVYRVRYRVEGEPLVSIVLPARPDANSSRSDGWKECERTLAMLVERTTYRRLEVLLPVASASDPALQIPRNLTVREVPMDGSPTRLGQQKRAAAHARGDHLLFLDWGLKPLDRGWLTGLLEFSQQAAIGAVGAKLHYADGSLKHVGILLGVNGVAAPALHRYPRSSLGYFGAAIAARNYSAVSGECLMTRRVVYDSVGGFDDEMGGFADIDYCLRVACAGYRVVFTPHAALVDNKPASSNIDANADSANQLRLRWSDCLAQDRYYNPNFSRDTPDYGLGLTVSSPEP
jgi:glycosyltransferase involved in cell wall biosynthesis